MVVTLEVNTVGPLNNGHIGDEHFVHSSEVVPSSEVLIIPPYCMQGGYNLTAISESMAAIVSVLLGDPLPRLPPNMVPNDE